MKPKWTNEREILLELIEHVIILIIGSIFAFYIAPQVQNTLQQGICLGVGYSLIASAVIFLVQRFLFVTPQEAINEVKVELRRAFHGFLIKDMNQIYEECLYWIRYSLGKGYIIYELCTTPNSEKFENGISIIVQEHLLQPSYLMKSKYYRWFDKKIDKTLEPPSEGVDEIYKQTMSIKKVEIEYNRINSNSDEQKKLDKWCILRSDIDVPTDALLIVACDKPIYAMIELYDESLGGDSRSVLSFSTSHEEFLRELYQQIKIMKIKNGIA